MAESVERHPDEIVNLRNKISGVAMSVTWAQAQDILDHPLFGEQNEIVRTDKPEVLADRSEKSASKDKGDEEK